MDHSNTGGFKVIDLTGRNIYVYTDPVDMRKSINGLVVLLMEEFEKNPQSNDLFLFVNRAKNKIKCLFWDRNGFVLYYKRLEEGRFNYSKHIREKEIVVSRKQLEVLLLGLDFHLLGEWPNKKYRNFF